MARTNFSESDVILYCDEREWVYPLVCQSLERLKKRYRVLTTETTPRDAWDVLSNTPHIVFLWDGRARSAADMCEFIFDINPKFDFAERIIVVVVNPLREDVIQLSEFGVKKIVRARQRDSDFASFQSSLANFLQTTKLSWEQTTLERLLDVVSNLSLSIDDERLDNIESQFKGVMGSLPTQSPKIRDFSGCLSFHRKKTDEAKDIWYSVIESHPSYFQGYQRLYEFFTRMGDYERALNILKRLQVVNPKSAKRLADFGETFLSLKEFEKSKSYFEKVLEKDIDSSRARSGLAKLYFEKEEFEQARKIMNGVPNSAAFAASLNRKGVDLVQKGLYEEALKHYSKAQYVLPSHDQHHKLIFNIALCCFRWNQVPQAVKFLNIALAKAPDYDRAKELLRKIKNE